MSFAREMIMDTTWVLVANQAGARLFESVTPLQGLSLLKDLPHPKGRLKGHDINTDKPGRVFKNRSTSMRSGTESDTPHELAVNDFARQLAEVLNHGHSHRSFANVVIVADPHLLGRIKNSLSNGVEKTLFKTLSKNLNDFSLQSMDDYLKAVIEDAYEDRIFRRSAS